MAFSRIRTIFKKHPVIANAVVYGGMCVTAEFSQQIVNKRIIDPKVPPEPVDKASLVRYAVVGSCINSNMLYFWYKWLDRKFPGRSGKIIVKKLILDQFVLTPHLLTAFYIKSQTLVLILTRFHLLDLYLPGRNGGSVFTKLLLHQIVFVPPFLSSFYISMSIMEGKDNILEELQQKFVPTFARSCLFWLPAQTINFLFVPPMARVVYVGTCSFVWVNILCWLKRTDINLDVEEKSPLS